MVRAREQAGDNPRKMKAGRQAEDNTNEGIMVEKKKTKKRRRSNNDGVSDRNCNHETDAIVCEILSRLPAKSLMRFKCVSKGWKFLIEKDPYFIDLHNARARARPRLYVVMQPRKNSLWLRYPPWILTGDLIEGKDQASAIVHSTWETDSITERPGEPCKLPGKMLGPVNGLICYVVKKVSTIYVFNVSTRKVTRLVIKPVLFTREGELLEHRTFKFGFDCATKEHKVLCVTKFRLQGQGLLYSLVCHVLTLGTGNSSWRRINHDNMFPCLINALRTESVCVNGSIYWINKLLWMSNFKYDPEPKLFAFDVGSEKFRTIPVPGHIRDEFGVHHKDTGSIDQHLDLIELNGNVALWYTMDNTTVKLWVFNDDYHKESRSITDANWAEEIITLPFHCDKDWSLHFCGVAGTDQIIMKSHKKHTSSALYVYNLKNKIFKKLEISGTFSNSHSYGRSFFSTYLESLLPVKRKLQRHQKQMS